MTNRTFRFIVYIQLAIIFSMLLLVTAGEHILVYVEEPVYFSAALFEEIESNEHALLD